MRGEPREASDRMVIPMQRLPLRPNSEISPKALARGKRAMV
jgi:hypothetical protein